jgi:hypothetical protein
MRAVLRLVAVAVSVGCAAAVSANAPTALALADVLQRAGERVEFFFARAQSIVCLEVVRLLPLSSSWSTEGLGRTVESELRLSWTPAGDGGPTTEAQTFRQLLRVNGHKPRVNDWNNCTTPEQQAVEPQPLSLLLPAQRVDYEFKLAGPTRLDERAAIMVDYALRRRATVESSLVDGRDDCVSFDVKGGMRGRLWIDAETYDVLRLDQRLSGMVEIPLPRPATRGPGRATSWTLERWDTTIRFKRVAFTNPDESLVLPVTMSSMRITRGSGTPRLRTMTDYTKYQRFMTGARVVGD